MRAVRAGASPRQVRDQKQHTAVMRKRTNCVFDHVMFFNFPHLTREDVENSTVDISVFDADLITRDDLIGSFQLDLHTVYLRPHHEVYKQWVGITDPVNKKDKGLQGCVAGRARVRGWAWGPCPVPFTPPQRFPRSSRVLVYTC